VILKTQGWVIILFTNPTIQGRYLALTTWAVLNICDMTIVVPFPLERKRRPTLRRRSTRR